MKRRNRLSRLEHPILLADQIRYFAPSQEAPPLVDVKNLRHLPFLKKNIYSDEQEFRFVFARQGGYELKQMIVNKYYKDSEEIANKTEQHVFIIIGPIRDIAHAVTL